MISVPDYIHPLIGWRCWGHVDPYSGGLKALTQHFYWLPNKVMQVRCAHCGGPIKPNFVPNSYNLTNNDGFYAFKTFNHLVEDCAFGEVVGQVYLWGQIVEATRGYRAEFAYPKALITSQRNANILQDKWNIPVEVGDVRQIYNDARARLQQKIENEYKQKGGK